ncbi:glutaredoxin family protein [Candidatus Saccharibacteria bacterium]|nr:glutaredoxin family protein [Candidatus Saccharibacteria bacterium]
MKKATIYTTQHCTICHSVMDWFDKTGVEYEERDVADDAAMAEVEKALGQPMTSAPITVIGDEAIQGFDRPAMLAAFEKLSAE